MLTLAASAFAAPCVWEGPTDHVTLAVPTGAEPAQLVIQGVRTFAWEPPGPDAALVQATLRADGVALAVTVGGLHLVGRAHPTNPPPLSVTRPVSLPGGLYLEKGAPVVVSPAPGGVAIRPRLPKGYSPEVDPVAEVSCDAVAVARSTSWGATVPTLAFLPGEHLVRATASGAVLGRFRCGAVGDCVDVAVKAVEGDQTHIVASAWGFSLSGWVDTAALGPIPAPGGGLGGVIGGFAQSGQVTVLCGPAPLELELPGGRRVPLGSIPRPTELVVDPDGRIRVPAIRGPRFSIPAIFVVGADEVCDR